MLEKCRSMQISLNIKKCIFVIPFGTLLGNIIYKEGLMVDPINIALILELPPPKTTPNIKAFLGYTGYHKKFIKGYATLVAPLEKIIKKRIHKIIFWVIP